MQELGGGGGLNHPVLFLSQRLFFLFFPRLDGFDRLVSNPRFRVEFPCLAAFRFRLCERRRRV